MEHGGELGGSCGQGFFPVPVIVLVENAFSGTTLGGRRLLTVPDTMPKISFNNGALAALCLVVLAAAAGCSKTKAGSNAARQLRQLLAQEWQYELKSNPESATYLGDKRYNSELTDYSPAGRRKDAETNRDFLQKFQAIDAGGLSADDALNRTLMIRRLRDAIDSYD